MGSPWQHSTAAKARPCEDLMAYSQALTFNLRPEQGQAGGESLPTWCSTFSRTLSPVSGTDNRKAGQDSIPSTATRGRYWSGVCTVQEEGLCAGGGERSGLNVDVVEVRLSLRGQRSE